MSDIGYFLAWFAGVVGICMVIVFVVSSLIQIQNRLGEIEQKLNEKEKEKEKE